MSQSHKPTRAPVCSRATARFAAIVDFPTPPLPLATAITCLISGIRVAAIPVPAPAGGVSRRSEVDRLLLKTMAEETPKAQIPALSALPAYKVRRHSRTP